VIRKLTDNLAKTLTSIVGTRRFRQDPASLHVYQCDALTHLKVKPLAVCLPKTTVEVAKIMMACYEAEMPVTARGAGTGLSGGALPAKDGGIIVDTSAMKRLIEVNVVDRYAILEPGHINLHLSDCVAEHGLFYAPDPSSQMVCTLGGNIAENSGGPHTLKYGSTVGHVLGLTVVLEDGEVVKIGGINGPVHGYDLVGAFVGSEGTLGIVTEAIVRLVPTPQTTATMLGVFSSLPAACRAVSDMIAEGVNAAAIEALDQLTIQAVEASVFAAGYPQDAAAVILVELDGHTADVAYDQKRVQDICKRHDCLSFEDANDPVRRKELWRGRKGAFGAMGRIAPDLYVMDCVVPRSKLEPAIVGIAEVCRALDLRLANVFHAGEGNLHPNISYDGRDHEEVERVLRAAEGIVEVCLNLGGALSGEHGVGVEKMEFMPLVFDDEALALFQEYRDAWGPKGLLNPGKILPTPRACTETKGVFSLTQEDEQ
jgi:glycolate oxidase subunit GlcD